MKTYFNEDYVRIQHDENNRILIMNWITSPTSEEYRIALGALLNAIEQSGTGKVIVDTTHLGAIHPDDQQWSGTEWTERALNVGYSQLAIILPTELFTRMSVEETMSQVGHGLSFAYFEYEETAIAWMKQ